MSSSALFRLFFTWIALLPAGCGGAVDSTGTGGSGPTGGSGGATTTGGSGGATTAGGSGGATTTGGSGGATTTGGTGGCAGACVTGADCPADQPVCTNLGGGACNVCLGPCGGAQCMGPGNTCVSDADCNASPDAKCVCAENGCTICVLGFSGGPAGFPGVLGEGVWLIGWSGGLDHFSWVRFDFDTATTGTFTLLDPQGVSLTPFYPCEGSGPFTANPGTGVVVLDLPPACGMPAAALDFLSFSPPGGYPPHATLDASILTMGQTISGYQHDAAFCDAMFTTCGDPFVP